MQQKPRTVGGDEARKGRGEPKSLQRKQGYVDSLTLDSWLLEL
jgi:hypothetical protein